MASLNKVTLIGNVGKDPDVRFTQKGDCILSFSLATTETWDGARGKQEKTEWHKVDVFGKLASALKDYVTKGKKLYVEGKLVYDAWEDKSGNKRITAKVRVTGFGSNIILLGAPGPNVAGTKSQASTSDDEDQGADSSEVPF